MTIAWSIAGASGCAQTVQRRPATLGRPGRLAEYFGPDPGQQVAPASAAARNAPLAVARRAVFELGSLLADLGAADRAGVLELLREEVLGLPVTT